ncbi:DUF2156 domain-containing protein [bacterium]|nr:MAG: DUF2156 domain-containing protein [bacterium]
MQLYKLQIRDKRLFSRYLSLKRHELSAYAFESIFIWQGIYEIRWGIIKDSLCIFFSDKFGCFAYLPPLSRDLAPDVVEKAFRIMDAYNQNKEISRIENIEEREVLFYRTQGYGCKTKPGDYLCRRSSLTQLKGNAFKSKRAAYNYFIKHYKFEYLDFILQYRDNCFKLYDRWSKERGDKKEDLFYRGMLGDSRSSFLELLENYRDFSLSGKIVLVNGELKGFSFGFKLNQDTFCIVFEITDLSIKGLSQFIFRAFCRDLKNYTYINIMDDSGLENLRRAKLSYRPVRVIPNYIISRQYAERH